MKKLITQLFFYVDGKEYPSFLGDLVKVEFIPRVGEKVKFENGNQCIVGNISHSFRETNNEVVHDIEIMMSELK